MGHRYRGYVTDCFTVSNRKPVLAPRRAAIWRSLGKNHRRRVYCASAYHARWRRLYYLYCHKRNSPPFTG